MNTSVWFHRMIFVLGSIVAGSLAICITQTVVSRPIPEIILVLGFIAIAGLFRLLVSPLNQNLFE